MANCSAYPLNPPLLVAIAQDTYLKPTTPFADMTNMPAIAAPKYGQDIESGIGRAAPAGQNVGATPAILEPKMRKLLTEFASGDKTGMAKRLFNEFLKKSKTVQYFDDSDLNSAANSHTNIEHFCNAALSAPNSPQKTAGKVRIHQSLKAAGWDIRKMLMPAGLGVPAFNEGSKWRGTGDFNNGLGLMINGVQYVYVIATHYNYNAGAGTYCLTLKFVFYDVFGLDDDDLREYGASSDFLSSDAAIGITAWWQLQHQHGYAPLITRIVVERSYEAPAT
jgi:hypothetical protein